MPTPSLRTLTEYEAQALARLPTQFRGKPRMQSLLLAMAGQHQDAEAGLFSLWAQRLLTTATGAALTQLGAVVGQERGGLTDESFRLRIYARLLINRSSGTIPELLAIFALITPLAAELLEYPPAAFELRLDGGALSLPDDFAAILRAARAAGVGAGLLYQTDADADTFTFDVEGGGGLGFPALGATLSEATTISSGGALVPALTVEGVLTLEVEVSIRVKAVDGLGGVLFEYRLQTTEAYRELGPGIIVETEGDYLYTESAERTALFLTYPEGSDPYVVGDEWEWTATGITPGGNLSGVLSA